MPERPNILFIMSDDHAAHAISAYGSNVNKTPNIDRLADEGARSRREQVLTSAPALWVLMVLVAVIVPILLGGSAASTGGSIY